MAHAPVLRIVHSSPAPVADIKHEVRELADLMQRLADARPDVLRIILLFARKTLASNPPRTSNPSRK